MSSGAVPGRGGHCQGLRRESSITHARGDQSYDTPEDGCSALKRFSHRDSSSFLQLGAREMRLACRRVHVDSKAPRRRATSSPAEQRRRR